MRLAPWVVALTLLVGGVARGDDDDKAGGVKYFTTIDAVRLEPASIGGARLVIDYSALDLRGNRIPNIDPKVSVGGSKLDAPSVLGTFGNADGAIAVVILVQVTQDYADAIPAITQGLHEAVFADKTLDHAQVAILTYGSDIGGAKLTPAKTAARKLDELTSDGTTADPALLDTLERALQLLRKAKPEVEGAPLRKLVVIIGDGRDRSSDRDRVTQLGQRAAKEGVRIDAMAYAPNKNRRPLLSLGELAKRSRGMFRFLATGELTSWKGALQQLADEIAKEYRITYFLPADTDIGGKKVRVDLAGRVVAQSNELKVPDLGCFGAPCDGYCADAGCIVPKAAKHRGIFGWILVIVGGVVGLALILGFIGWLQQRGRVQLPAGFTPPPGWVPPPTKAPKAPKSRPPKGVPVVAMAPPPPASGPSFVFVNGPQAGQRIFLTHGFLIGKSPTAQLVIDDGYTSSNHAQIAIDTNGAVNLYDFHSTNGTFVNGVRVQQAVLVDGQQVRIGSTELRFLAQ